MEMIKDLAIMVMELADVDMEIVVGEQYAYGHNPIGKLRPRLFIPEVRECNYKVLDLIEELYGISIERSDIGDAIFAIAHEIGHYMETANKSKLARLIRDIKHAKHKAIVECAYDEVNRQTLELKLKSQDFANEVRDTLKLMQDCLDNNDYSNLSEIYRRQEVESIKKAEMERKAEIIQLRLHDCDLAYRLMPNEAFADKWAIEFIKANFPELIVGRA